jgi:hypothetical protein
MVRGKPLNQPKINRIDTFEHRLPEVIQALGYDLFQKTAAQFIANCKRTTGNLFAYMVIIFWSLSVPIHERLSHLSGDDNIIHPNIFAKLFNHRWIG